eukprot:11480004-Prorocentrum_lima.AAC.1
MEQSLKCLPKIFKVGAWAACSISFRIPAKKLSCSGGQVASLIHSEDMKKGSGNIFGAPGLFLLHPSVN